MSDNSRTFTSFEASYVLLKCVKVFLFLKVANLFGLYDMFHKKVQCVVFHA